MSDKDIISTRFSGPSDKIDLKKLERETKKLFFLGLLVAILANAAAGAVFMFFKTGIKVIRPPAVEFIYIRPKMTRVMRIDKKYKGARILRRKKMLHRKSSVQIQYKLLPEPEFLFPDFDFSTEIIPIDFASFIFRDFDIETKALKDPEKQISMREEMISLNDLDTGRYKAMIVQAPGSKQKIRGFIYIPTAWGVQLKPPDSLKRAVLNLVEAVNRYTNITAKSDPHLLIDSRKLHDMPFVYITTDKAFELTEIERRNLGRYLRNGGFLLADNGTPGYEFGQAEASLRQMLKDALGTDARFLPIPHTHPVYHCFFDFEDGPPLGGEVRMMSTTTTGKQGEYARNAYMAKRVSYLEGIWLDNRLVAIYSDKGYATKWKNYVNNEPQLKMGVNMVVFALTQRGGIVQQKMDFYTAVQ